MEKTMQVETVGTFTAAELELEASLKQLREAITRVPEDEQGILAPVQASLVALTESTAKDLSFVKALVGLARTIIEVRQKAQRGPLKTLPVPPYDLWLPFKAVSQRPPSVWDSHKIGK